MVRKNIVEYEIWLFMQREAEAIVQHAERFLAGPHPRVCPATLRPDGTAVRKGYDADESHDVAQRIMVA